MNLKRIAIGGGIAIALVIGGVGVANATGALSPGSKASVGWDGKVVHECVALGTHPVVYANTNPDHWNPDTCPAGQTQFHFSLSAAPTDAQVAAQVAVFCAAHNGCAGPAGKNGTDGTDGAPGTAGTAGIQGPKGDPGTPGKDGVDAQAPTYGIALVNVSRGGTAATTWATYSTTIGSPVGDTTSGTFRMTCSAANAPCAISVQAYATTSGVKVYPRVDISKQDYNSGAPLGNCEYGDGTDNNGSSSAALSTDASSPTAVTLGIGGTLDCGSAQTYPTNGIATEIDVPAGFYDIAFTGTFKK